MVVAKKQYRPLNTWAKRIMVG